MIKLFLKVAYSGIQGNKTGNIYADKDIYANFIENATIIAERNIKATSIMHSNVSCGMNLEVFSNRGFIVGGKIVAGRCIC